MKTKILFITLPLLFVGAVASAQVGGSAAGSAGYGVATPSVVATPGTVTSMPTQIMPINDDDAGFVQFNNLTVTSVSSGSAPGEIIATINGGPIPMMDATTNSAAVMSASPGSAAVSASTQVMNCWKFSSKDSTVKTAIPCPTPRATNTTSQAVTSQNQIQPTAASGAADASTGVSAPAYYPMQVGYRIEVSAATQLLLRDRTRATIGSFSAGDQINVFGYYNSDGSIEAYLARDLSKPVERQTLQLNNMTLIGISGTSLPATLAVTQINYNPCYRYDLREVKTTIVCPMGATTFSTNSGIKVNEAISPNWRMQRKYAIVVDANTILLDRNRKVLTLADLKEGDELNIYGETSDNAETVTADIVRDMSLPATPVSMSGTVTALNADGSFAMQTNDGRAVTVQNPIKVGTSITVQGMYDRRASILSSITQFYFGPTMTTLPYPMPASPVMMKTSTTLTQ